MSTKAGRYFELGEYIASNTQSWAYVDIGIEALWCWYANGSRIIRAGRGKNELHAMAIVFFVHASMRIRRFARRGLLDLGRSQFA